MTPVCGLGLGLLEPDNLVRTVHEELSVYTVYIESTDAFQFGRDLILCEASGYL
jgi:hypothetical protein